ncbi:hypothetical protein C4D60_Mb06t26330 [Musa balbisiana]|uniref:Uncharacterized protein n=1 Tax=Musa balbisiana TaxID=52838 RepID=A0A4S8IQS5_MUSBA|nr:hypothetical protein C4D60_Mb06t26330 [Musa balbisiana]
MDSRGERGSNMALLLYCALICLFSVSALLLTSAHPDVGSLTSVSHAQHPVEAVEVKQVAHVSTTRGAARRCQRRKGAWSAPRLACAACSEPGRCSRHILALVGAGGVGWEAAGAERRWRWKRWMAGIVSSAVRGQVRRLHAVQPGPRGGAAGQGGGRGVLPGGLAVQVRQQALHALTIRPSPSQLPSLAHQPFDEWYMRRITTLQRST